jgi:cytoskeletal protein CcmA (bactofilin family)
MALWKEQSPTMQKEAYEMPKIEGTNGSLRHEELTASPRNGNASGNGHSVHPHRTDLKESVIAAELTIEGKIEGAGHVRIAGRFKGDIHVDGNLTIEEGALLAGELRADTIVISGELQGNIQGASHVELMESGTITGDVKAGTMTVAKGSRMRGKAEFGWNGSSAVPGERKELDVSTV